MCIRSGGVWVHISVRSFCLLNSAQGPRHSTDSTLKPINADKKLLQMCIRSGGVCVHICVCFYCLFFFFFFGVVCEFNISLRALCLCIFCAKLYTVTLCKYVELKHDSENMQNWNWKENKLNLSTYSLRSSLAWTSFDSRLRYTSRSRSTLLLSMFNAAQSWHIQMKYTLLFQGEEEGKRDTKFSEIYMWNS